ncbi:unnamed protein product [Lasius platythorax]|uniref:CCHC-type domain-containing protein n=1 Tax=Lasius platythorax TaxID=488582 RepID=A0AAV2N5H9_9HYME
MYVRPQDVQKIPENMQINYDNTTYWIYLSTEKLSCFLCKEEGHLAKYCKNIELNLQNSPPINDSKQQSTNITTESNQMETNVLLKPKESDPPSIIGIKRPLSSDASTASNQEESKDTNTQSDNIDKIRKTKKKAKRQQIASKMDITQQLQPAKEYLTTNEKKYSLNFNDFAEFLLNTYGNSNITEIAHKYTNDLTALNNMLTDTYGLISERNLKSRITRIKKYLRQPTDDNIEEVSSDAGSSVNDNVTQSY